MNHKNIAVIGTGGYGANLVMLLLEEGHNVLAIDGDFADHKFFRRFLAFSDSKIFNDKRPKVNIVRDVAARRGYGDNLKIKYEMIIPEYDFNIFKNFYVIICTDTVQSRQIVELGLKKAGITNFIHVGCNLNSISIFKTIDNMLDSPTADNATSSYVTEPNARTYMLACLELMDVIEPKTTKFYKEL